MDILVINQPDKLAYLIDISYCDSQGAITQTVREVFKDLVPADIWSSTKHLVQETEIWELGVRI